MLNASFAPLTVICGHYGSGKTNIAVNLAIEARKQVPSASVHIADIDIVNPYFRTADAAELLEQHQIDVLVPPFANTNVDIPSLPPKLVALFDAGEGHLSIIDVGGDDGSVALGMYHDRIRQAGYQMIYVVNCYRPLIADPRDALGCMREIEEAAHLRCTHLVNNSSLGAETTAEDILDSVEYAHQCAEICGLPLAFHAYCPEYVPDVPALFQKHGYENEPLLALTNATRRLY